jgi:hypothetical protein
MRKVVVEASSVPPQLGVRVRCLSIDDTPPEGDYPAGFKWVFQLLEGPNIGAKSYRTIGQTLKSANAAGKFVAGGYGRAELPLGVEVDLDFFVGREFIADIVASANGKGSRVEAIRPVPQAGAPQAQAAQLQQGQPTLPPAWQGQPQPQPQPWANTPKSEDIPFALLLPFVLGLVSSIC